MRFKLFASSILLALLAGCASSGTATAPVAAAPTFEARIDGEGYFTLRDESGRAIYTRDGRFALNQQGELVAFADGLPVEPRICVPCEATIVHVLADGSVMVWTADSEEAVAVGTLDLVIFEHPAALRPVGGGRFVDPANLASAAILTPGASPAGRIVAGAMFPGGQPATLSAAGDETQH